MDAEAATQIESTSWRAIPALGVEAPLVSAEKRAAGSWLGWGFLSASGRTVILTT
jgi:hypothetical protein